MLDDLVERARRGDRDAFGSLAASRLDRLNTHARLILRDPDMADDVVQEVLLRCWRFLPNLRDVSTFDGWLYRLLVRAANDELRRHKRLRRSITQIRLDPGTADSSLQLAQRDQLERAFTRLSVDHRAIVVLRHYLDLPLHEIATTLGISVGTAKSRYHHAMAAMRAALDADARLGSEGALA